MNSQTLTLELLVKSGNVQGTALFANKEGLDKDIIADKIAEAGIYREIRYISSTPEEFDSDACVRFFGSDNFSNYFARTTNVPLLTSFVKAIHAATNVNMEEYAQLAPFDVLGLKSVYDGLRKNSNAVGLKESLVALIQRGYSLVFSPGQNDEQTVGHYFSIINKWKDIITPEDIAKMAIQNYPLDLFTDTQTSDEERLSTIVLDNLIELTGIATVSRLMYETYGGTPSYARLVGSGRIDPYVPQVHAPRHIGINPQAAQLIEDYETERDPSFFDFDELSMQISPAGRKYLGTRMGEWLKEGKARHTGALMSYGSSILYDETEARKSITEAIAQLSENGEVAKLLVALSFPQQLIDTTNPKVSAFADAYLLCQETDFVPIIYEK